MPRIPEATSRVQPQGPVNQPRLSAEALGAPAAGLRQLGRGVQEVAATVHEVNVRKEKWEAEMLYAKSLSEWTVLEAESKKSASPGAPEFAEQTERYFDTWRQNKLAEAPQGRAAQEYLALRFETLRGKAVTDAAEFQATAAATKSVQDMTDIARRFRNEVRANPGLVTDRVAEMEALVQAAPFRDEQMRAQFRTEQVTALWDSDLDGFVSRIERDPTTWAEVEMHLAAMRDGYPYKGAASPAAYDDALTRLEKRRLTADVDDRASLNADLRDTIAQIHENGRDPGRVTRERALRVLRNADDAERVMRQVSDAQAFYTSKQSIVLQSAADDQAMLAKWHSEVGGVGAAHTAEDVRRLEAAVTAKWAEYGRDPAQYVMRNVPSVRAKQEEALREYSGGDMAKAKALWQEYAVAVAQHQVRLGTTPYQVEYLGKTQAAAWAADINADDPTRAMAKIRRLEQLAGDKWPTVLRELREQKLDPLLRTLGRLDPGRSPEAMARLVSVRQQGIDVLRKGVDPKVVQTIEQLTNTRLQPLRKQFAAMGVIGESIPALADEKLALDALALSLYGSSPDIQSAVNQAYRMLFTDNYDMKETYRTPTIPGRPGEFGNVVESYITNFARDITAEHLAPAQGGDPRMTPQQRQRATMQLLRRSAVWANTPGGDGVRLMISTDSGAKVPVRWKDGTPVDVKFSDITTAQSTGQEYIVPPGMGGQ